MADSSVSYISTTVLCGFSPEKVESRREFFRATARYGLLALVSAAAGLAARPRTPAGSAA